MDDKQSLVFYQDSAGEWRWRVRDLTNRTEDPDGEIVAAATEGFSSKDKAEENWLITVNLDD